MTNRSADGDLSGLLAADPERLTRDELIDLARRLQTELARGRGPRPAASPALRDARHVPGVDFTVVFDGGSLGNPGRGYGSYQIVEPAGVLSARQIEFGDGMTNNQAEFRALIAGLDELLQIIGARAATMSLAVRGDSQLVIRGLTGEWKVKHPGLQPLHRQALEQLSRFRATDLAWQPRRESVRTFGH